MKEIYLNYYDHFSRLNSQDFKSYDAIAKLYHCAYGDQLPRNKECKILDIGCGMGHFLYYLKKEGFLNFYGIDLCPQQVEFIKNNITNQVEVADMYEFLKNNVYYDVICMNDVIEHIPKSNLIGFMRLLYSRLSDGGILLIKTDNMATPFGLRGRYMDYTHEIGYTEHSLYEIMSISGFKDIIIRGSDPMELTIIRRLIRNLIHKMIGAMFYLQGFPIPSVLHKDLVCIGKKK